MSDFARFAVVRLKLLTLDERLVLDPQLSAPFHCPQPPELMPSDQLAFWVQLRLGQ